MVDPYYVCKPRRRVTTADGRPWWVEGFNYTTSVPIVVTMYLTAASPVDPFIVSTSTVLRMTYEEFAALYPTLIEEDPVTPWPKYASNPKHRNNSSYGSQWTITIDEEHKCFFVSKQRGWFLSEVGWGLHFADASDNPDYLGTAAMDRNRRLFVAKFVASSEPVVWHGYPADTEKNAHDIPPESIAAMWLSANVLKTPKVRKILMGQRCRL